MLLFAAAVSFAVALGAVLAIERRAAAIGLIDRPNSRSSHVVPRPRGGGLGIVLGAVTGAAVFAASGSTIDASVWTILGASIVVAGAGLRDDVSPVGVAPRLAAQIAAAAIVVWVCGGLARLPLPPPLDLPVGGLGIVLAAIWIVAVTNFFNFMDGADGLAAGQAIITCAAIATTAGAASATLMAVLALAATLAFLPRNWAPARIFLGDVGSGWLGFVLATIPFAGALDRREDLLLLVATSLALFLVDPVVTLVRRFVRGAPLTASHREHAYQRLFDPQASHAPVVAGLLAAATLVSVLGAWAYRRPDLAWPALIVAMSVTSVEWWAASRRSRRR